MNIIDILQIGSVFFGTIVAAPLIISNKYNKKIIGFMAMAAGSSLAMVVQLYAGLYYFFFASAFWFLNSVYAIRKLDNAQKKLT
jgi:hypothetical protein|tara:strand:- start:1716 stop:1967 length:252 start_codon:yes stop_codon:yes gene_type:complete